MATSKKITVFTPVYNRAHLINVVYDSLVKQNVSRELFEWLIVDDGSTDNIQDVVDGFKKDNAIDIRLHTKSNGGVHTAWNTGVREAHGEYFFRCDSDDEVASDALSKILIHVENFSAELQKDCVGITGLCARKEGNQTSIIGGPFPEDVFISSGLEMNFKHNLKGERAGCMRTEVLKLYPLPEPKDVNFVFESTMWYKIDRKYKTICVNDTFKYYTENGEDSISSSIANTLNKKYCTSQYYSYTFYINEIYDYMALDKSYLFKVLANVTRRGLEADRNIGQIVKGIKGTKKKLFVVGCMPLGLLLYARDKKKFKAA